MTTIPASQTVQVNPGVLNAGGQALALNGLVLTKSNRVPIGTVQTFSSAAAVASFFGQSSHEAQIAGGGANLGSGYFGGFDGSTMKPGALLFAQYPAVAVSAYLRGGNAAATLTLAQLQAINGTLSVIMDGYPFAAGSLNLSAATSYSSAAGIIATALNAAPPTEATIAGSITGTTLTVSNVVSGAVAAGQTLIGSGVTSGTIILSQIDGTPGGDGDYLVNISQAIGSESMTTQPTPVTVTFDSVSGGFIITSGTTGAVSTAAFATGTTAAALMLTAATGAVISQGAVAATPVAFMNQIVQVTQNWASFMTAFDPDGGSGNTQKLAFASWVNTTDDRYVYVCADSDLTPTLSVPATSSMGYLLAQSNSSGTCLVYEPSDLNQTPFVMGAIASIDFTEPNGRLNFKFCMQSGLQPGVTNGQVADNLRGNPQVIGDRGNGYNFYGANATANNGFTYFDPGYVSGPFMWLDTYVNEIWLTNQFQLDLMTLLTTVKSIPFNPAGYAQVAAALNDTINQALSFGAIRPDVTLSANQISEVNAAAGTKIDDVLSTRGWYLQIVPASPTTRQGRGPLQGNFFYNDGGSVNSIDLSSIVLL